MANQWATGFFEITVMSSPLSIRSVKIMSLPFRVTLHWHVGRYSNIGCTLPIWGVPLDPNHPFCVTFVKGTLMVWENKINGAI